mgnify:FL=1
MPEKIENPAERAISERHSRKEEPPFPEDPNKRLESVLSSVNVGPKAATLLLLPYGSYISPADLVRNFRPIMAGTGMEHTSFITAPNYCGASLVPIGLVAKEYTMDYFGRDILVGYELTDAGKRYGIPASALALFFERQHQTSLYPILGQIGTRYPEQHRGPYSRAMILTLLSKRGGRLREADICQELGISLAVAHKTFLALVRAGVVTYESVNKNTDKTQVTYRKNIDEPVEVKPYRVGSNSMPGLTRTVMNIADQLARDGVPISQVNVYSRLQESQLTARKNKKGLRGAISAILSHLARQGFLSRTGFQGRVVESRLEITPLGTDVVQDFIIPLTGLVNDDESIRGRIDREIVPEVMGKLSIYARNSAELYYPYSVSFKNRQTQDNLGKLTEILSEQTTGDSRGSTITELADKMGLNINTIHSYLTSLRKDKRVERFRGKGVDYYKIVSQTDSSKEV